MGVDRMSWVSSIDTCPIDKSPEQRQIFRLSLCSRVVSALWTDTNSLEMMGFDSLEFDSRIRRYIYIYVYVCVCISIFFIALIVYKCLIEKFLRVNGNLNFSWTSNISLLFGQCHAFVQKSCNKKVKTSFNSDFFLIARLLWSWSNFLDIYEICYQAT